MTDCTHREQALLLLPFKLAQEIVAIWPRVMHGEGGYQERPEWMEGWNKCAYQITRNIHVITRWLHNLPDDSKTTIENLLLEGGLHVTIDTNEKVVLQVICNDMFDWGCSSYEDVSLTELPNLLKAIKDSTEAGNANIGPYLWVARKRQMRPQRAFYDFLDILDTKVGELFDACGEPRDD